MQKEIDFMNGNGEFLTNVNPEDMTTLALIHAMRSMSDNLKLLSTDMRGLREELSSDRAALGAVNEKLIRMEENTVNSDVKVLRAEVDVIKLTLAEQRGAFKLGDWLRNFAPWFLAIGGWFYALFAQPKP